MLFTKKSISLGFLLLSLLNISCVKDSEEDMEPQLVIEGWIEEGGYPTVFFGVTQAIQEGMSYRVNDYIVRWGKVSISDGENTVILTGGYDNNVFPPYKYTSFNMTGKAGKTYTLKAEYEGKTVTATTTIPRPVKLDSLRLVPTPDDSLFYIKAFFKDNPEEKNYYTLFNKRIGADKSFLLSFMGVINDEVVPTQVAADVYRGTDIASNLDRDNQSVYFKRGDKVQVKLAHLDETAYRFWKSYSNLNNLSSNMIFPFTQNLESNIQGGKGYWCGYGSSTQTVYIK